MSKDMERKIILIMVLYLVFLGLSGCANTTKANTKSTEQANISVYNGTISKMLGCIFAPSECEKFKKTRIKRRFTGRNYRRNDGNGRWDFQRA